MHELSIALSLLDLVAEESARHGGARVVAIHLKLGPFSGVVKEALTSAFAMVREESSAQDAALVIDETPIVAYCPTCAAERGVVSPQRLCCVVCGSPTPQIVRGRELEVTALEIET